MIFHTQGLLTEERAAMLVDVIKRYFGLEAWAWEDKEKEQ